MTNADSHEMRLDGVEGVGLHAVLWASGDREPWLLVHGLASNCRTWERVARNLNDRGHPVATVDLRGHGRSDKPDTGYDFSTMGEDLVLVLDALGWPTAFLAGQSMGGNLAVDFAAQHPHRLSAVVGVDGGSIELSRRWPEWDDCAQRLRPPALSGTRREAVERMLVNAHPDWDDWGIGATLDNLEHLADGTVKARLSLDHHLEVLRALWEHRPSEILGDVEVPVLLVLAGSGSAEAGEWDRARRAEVARIAEAAPRVVTHWIDPADHDIHVQKPAELAAVMDSFTEGLGP